MVAPEKYRGNGEGDKDQKKEGNREKGCDQIGRRTPQPPRLNAGEGRDKIHVE